MSEPYGEHRFSTSIKPLKTLHITSLVLHPLSPQIKMQIPNS